MTPPSPLLLGSYTRFLLRWRRLLLTLAALVALLAGARMALTYRALKSDLVELLPEGAPSVGALSVLRERIPGIRHLGVVVAIDDPKRQSQALEFLDALAERAAHYPKTMVAQVRADSRRERAFAETFAFSLMAPSDVRELREAVERRRDWDVSHQLGLDLEDDEEAPRPEIPIKSMRDRYEARFGKARSSPGDHFVSADGKSAAMLMQVAGHETSQTADVALLERVQADVQALSAAGKLGPGLRVGYAGDVAARVEEARGLQADLTWSSAMVLLLVAGSIVWFYRSRWAIPILGLPLAVGTASSFGLVALPPLSIVSLNTNTAFLASIVVGNGINSGIILLARFLEDRRAGASVDAAVDSALTTTWKATLAASLAAAVAYGSLVFTQFRGFNQFGWIGGIGLLTCWLANYSVLPMLVTLWGARFVPSERAPTPEQVQPSGPTRLALERPRLILAFALGASLLASGGLFLRRGDWIEYDLSKLRRRDSFQTGERYWGKRMDAALGTYLTPTVVLSQSAREAEVIEARLRDLAARGGAGGLIGTIRSAALFQSPERAEALAEARRLKAVLTPRLLAEVAPADRERLERALSPKALAPMRMSDIPSSLLTGLVRPNGELANTVLVYPKVGAATWNAELLDTYTRDLRQAASYEGSARPVAGSLLLSSDLASAMSVDGPKATRLSLLLVLGICWLAFRAPPQSGAQKRRFLDRSFGYSLAAMASLGLAILLMMGFLGLAGQRINFSNFVALPITFGVGADYAINVLRRHQADHGSSLSRSLASTGGAVALCSATTVIGFGSLLMAQNRALFSFGVFAILGEFACLFTAVVVLPAVFSLWEQRHTRRPIPTLREA